MSYPYFYSQVPDISLYDPLSDFLGAFEQGKFTISYLECVKLAGHSCPTVAGAYLMTLYGLRTLYPDTLPQRGSIKVEMRESKTDGVTGVIANVTAFIVGAGGVGGFKGIKGNFSRDNLIVFDAPIQGEMKLTRLDTHESTILSYNPSMITPDEIMQPLMDKSLQCLATDEEKEIFKKLWQKRVSEILLSTDQHAQMITIKKD